MRFKGACVHPTGEKKIASHATKLNRVLSILKLLNNNVSSSIRSILTIKL